MICGYDNKLILLYILTAIIVHIDIEILLLIQIQRVDNAG